MSATTLRDNVVSGPGWSLVGDASGAVDPLTREGIRHALASADLLADAFEAKNPASYAARWRAAFLPELSWAATRADRFFEWDLTSRVVRYARRSSTIRKVMVDLVTGRQDYLSLKKRLLWSAPAVGIQLLVSKAAASRTRAEAHARSAESAP